MAGEGGSNVVYKPKIVEGAPQISRHFYVHEGPEDKQDIKFVDKEHIVHPQKHYKIIFIKAGGAGGGTNVNNIAAFPANEEKTIVYVLSKGSDGSVSDADLPEAPVPVTSKPEVFFVKYNNNEDSEQIVAKVRESFQEGGAGYNSPGSFAASIGASKSSGGGGGSSGGSSSGSFGGNRQF